MGSELDPEVAQALAPIFEAMAGSPPLAVGDIETRRVAVEGLIGLFFSAMPAVDDVKVTEYEATSHDGYQVPLRLYTKDGAASGPVPQRDGRGPISNSSSPPLASRSCGRYVFPYGLPFTVSPCTYTLRALLPFALITSFLPFSRRTVAFSNSGEPIA